MRKPIGWALVVGLALSASASAGDWINLFDGKTLKGWSVHSGYAKYHVEDGMIVGTAVKGSPNTFLCTDREFCDFILEFEVKVDPKLNSGVQFRSKIAPKEIAFIFRGKDGKPRTRRLPPDRVYGYQVEISNEAQGNAGNIYDEARRGMFLDDFTNKPKARAAFKDNQWNKYRVECKGDSIKTWINGVPCADIRDALTPCGVIGLQVHGVHRNFQPYQVRWRNIRIKVLD